VLGPERSPDEALATTVAHIGMERYATQPGAPWLSETPSLMLGLAGTGHFYLRLSDPAIPSILVPRYEDGLVPD
ncbi:MAG TPA: hypothetical protein VFU22_02490, partial [Roseiflexaceae bacterium]|nr:hypothetical protein [Roseiflexaceae bacterium]